VCVVVCVCFCRTHTDLRKNRFKEFPSVLFRLCATLEHLYLGFNSLIRVPSLCSFVKLQELDLSNNDISGLTEGFVSRTQLSALNLENNNIQRLVVLY